MQGKGFGTLAEAAAARVRKLDPQLDLGQAAADPFFSRGAGFGNETGGEGNGQTAGDRAEPEIIGPVDLPLMSFDDDEDTKPAEEAAAGAAEEAAAASAAQAAQDAAAQTAAAESAAEAAAAAKEKAAEDAAASAAEAAASSATEQAAEAKAAEAKAAEAKAAEAAEVAKAAEETAAEAAEMTKAAEETAAKAAEMAKAAEETAAKAATGPAVEEPPDGGYVDLSAVLLGEEVRTEEKSTRFVVPYEEPTGDDQADFERMLAQFREKVSENIDANDAMAHYDLGTAYMEMGLLDEAISEFQVVLRGTSDHLGTYEMLGQTFLQKKEPEAALRSLNRGLDAPCEVEEERVGIYYYIGLAHETIGDKDTAVEYYDRVFALDINFADVTERLRALRS